MNNSMASFDWSCPFCRTRSEQHPPDCQRNSPENRKLREAIGQCLPGGYAIDKPLTDQPTGDV